MQKIAEKEDIKVHRKNRSSGESPGRTVSDSTRTNSQDLQKRNGLIEIYDQVMNEKVIDFLQQNAKN